ncbi:phage tail tape measure protein, partial [Pseudomonas sp. GW247-3R2A]
YFGGGEGGEGIIKTATNKANELAEEQRVRNAGPGGGDGSFVEAGAVEGAQRYQRMMKNAAGIPSTEKLLSRPNLANQSSGLLQQASG